MCVCQRETYRKRGDVGKGGVVLEASINLNANFLRLIAVLSWNVMLYLNWQPWTKLLDLS